MYRAARKVESRTDRLPIHIECHVAAFDDRRDVDPLADGQDGRIDLVFHVLAIDRVLDGQSQRAAVRLGAEEKILIGSRAEVEDALPIGTTVPADPARHR